MTTIANDVAASIATMSVSLSPCSVPGQESSFHLEQDEMELGLGECSKIMYCKITECSIRAFYRFTVCIQNHCKFVDCSIRVYALLECFVDRHSW